MSWQVSECERESRGKNVRQIIVKNGGKKERKKRELGRNWKEKQVGWWAVIYKVAKYGMFRAIISPSVSVEQRETEQFIDWKKMNELLKWKMMKRERERWTVRLPKKERSWGT